MEGARPWKYSLFFYCFLSFSKEEIDSLPVLLYILKNEMLLIKPFSLSFSHPGQHHFWENNLKIFIKMAFQVGFRHLCFSLRANRKETKGIINPLWEFKEKKKRSLESQLISDIKNWVLLLVTSCICHTTYCLSDLFKFKIFKFPFKMSPASNPRWSLLRSKVQENIPNCLMHKQSRKSDTPSLFLLLSPISESLKLCRTQGMF